ncbi:MAG: response regulator [Saprospiraceae bacterium]|jgi:CheY-like chemotaxis protein|nr:response regulator [Saprospiraceae bacterium]
MQITSRNKSIFLADDDTDDCLIFGEALKALNEGVELTITYDGVQLLSTLDETVPPPPYVIFLDLNMPRKNGFEALSEIRRNDKFKDIPVVILSTASNPDIIERTFHLGANYFVRKPSTFSQLSEAIKTVLSLDLTQLHTQPERQKFVLSA